MSLDFELTIEADVGNKDPYVAEIFSSIYINSVIPMWKKAGVYDCLYKSSGKQAKSIVGKLELGIQEMINYKEDYIKLNPKNGWGEYYSALEFLKEVCENCKKYPKSIIFSDV